MRQAQIGWRAASREMWSNRDDRGAFQREGQGAFVPTERRKIKRERIDKEKGKKGKLKEIKRLRLLFLGSCGYTWP